MSPDQKQELVAILEAGPMAAAYSTDLWTCGRVAEVVHKEVRVSGHLGRVLHDLRFSPRKPQQVGGQQDTEAIARWRKKDYPRIKKARRREAALY